MMHLREVAVGVALLGAMVCGSAAQTSASGGVNVDSRTSSCGSISTALADLSSHSGGAYPGIRSSFNFACLPGATSAAMYTRTMTSGAPGTYVSGVWSVDHMFSDTAMFDRRAIANVWGGTYDFNGIGDKALTYWYAHFFGGMVAYNDEGIEPVDIQAVQVGYPEAKIRTIVNGSNGSMDIVTPTPVCKPAGSAGCVARAGDPMYDDGGYLYDSSRPLTKGMTVASSGGKQVLHGMVLAVDGTPLTVSSAWGYVNAATCTHNKPGGGSQQVYGAVTCSMKMDGHPASPGDFVAGVPTCVVGSFEEEVQVTEVGRLNGGVQQVTFNGRYPWSLYGSPMLMMQGGLCGTLAVQSSKWPMGWPVVGAFSSSELVFANCHNGFCSGGSTGMIPSGPKVKSFGASGTLTRTNNVVTYTGSGYTYAGTYSYPVGSTIVVSGWTPGDLNGTYTVTANTMDAFNIKIQWKQEGANETSAGSAGEIGGEHPELTLYPAAEIIGTDGGQVGHVQLATNHMDKMGMVVGDTVIGAPTTEYQSNGINYVTAQSTPNDAGTSSGGINVTDAGASPVGSLFRASNAGVTPGFSMFQAAGSWQNYFLLQNRPANNGYIIHVNGGEPVSPNVKPYYLFGDTSNYASLSVHPEDSSIHSRYSFHVDGGVFVVGPNANAYFKQLQSAVGSVLTVGKGGIVTANNPAHLTVTGAVTAMQVIASGAAPTVAAGTGARCTIVTGMDMAGVISCTTGATPIVRATLATVTFHGALTVAPQGCMLMARNASAAAASVSVYTTAPSTTAWRIGVGATALAASTIYSWSYQCE